MFIRVPVSLLWYFWRGFIITAVKSYEFYIDCAEQQAIDEPENFWLRFVLMHTMYMCECMREKEKKPVANRWRRVIIMCDAFSHKLLKRFTHTNTHIHFIWSSFQSVGTVSCKYTSPTVQPCKNQRILINNSKLFVPLTVISGSSYAHSHTHIFFLL